jgi:hypothetical protein
MNQKLPDRPIRRTVDFDQEAYLDICGIASARSWSFSYTCYVLLQSALKERNRKKKKPNDEEVNKTSV